MRAWNTYKNMQHCSSSSILSYILADGGMYLTHMNFHMVSAKTHFPITVPTVCIFEEHIHKSSRYFMHHLNFSFYSVQHSLNQQIMVFDTIRWTAFKKMLWLHHQFSFQSQLQCRVYAINWILPWMPLPWRYRMRIKLICWLEIHTFDTKLRWRQR